MKDISLKLDLKSELNDVRLFKSNIESLTAK